VVRAGETHEHRGITIKIVEVIPYQDFSKRKCFMVGYQLIDGKWTSPIAHWWQGEREDPRPIIERIVENYLTVKPHLR